jgi:4Fe-4S ferredoxin
MSKPECKEPGRVVPVIDRNRCEGKEDCAKVCPYNVFELGKLDQTQRKELSFVGKLKAFGHGYKQAFVVRGQDCHACGLCVTACPERAIKLAGV